MDQVASIKMWWHLDGVTRTLINTLILMRTPATLRPPSDQLRGVSNISTLLRWIMYLVNIWMCPFSQWDWSVMQWWQGDDSDKGVVPGQCQHMRPKSAEAPRLPKPPATTSNTPRIETRWNVIHMVLISSLSPLSPFFSDFFCPMSRTWIGCLAE